MSKTLAQLIADPTQGSVNAAMGEQADAESKSVVLSTGSKALLTSIATLLTAIGNNTDGLEGFTDGLEALLTAGNASLATIATAAADTTTDSPVASHQPCDVVSFTPTLDTSAYASGDVLFATAAIAGAARANDKQFALMSLAVTDKSDNKPAFTLYFAKTNVTSGAFNGVPSISDADAASVLGYVDVAAADWKDLGGADVVCYKGIQLLLEPVSGGTTIYVFAVLTAGTPTFAVNDLVFNLGFVQA